MQQKSFFSNNKSALALFRAGFSSFSVKQSCPLSGESPLASLLLLGHPRTTPSTSCWERGVNEKLGGGDAKQNSAPPKFAMIKQRFIRTSIFLAFCLTLLDFTFAQVSFDLGGELSTDFSVGLTEDAPLGSVTKFDLKASSEVGSGFFPDASFEVTLRTKYDAAENDVSIELLDAYALLFLDDVDLSIGNQTIAWGSTDGINPVDVVNPRDLASGLVDSEKLPVPMLRATYNASSDVKVDGVIVPVFRASSSPTTSPALPTDMLPSDVNIVGQDAPQENLPEAKLENVQFGLRTTFNLDLFDGADASFSYFHGILTRPTVTVNLNSVSDKPDNFMVQPVLIDVQINSFPKTGKIMP